MKKILVVALLVAVVCVTFCTVANASSAEQQIEQIAIKDERVTKAKVALKNRICLVAICAKKFTTRSQYLQYVDTLREQIKSNFEVDQVFVTRNPKLFSQLEEYEKLDESERLKKIEQLVDYLLEKLSPPTTEKQTTIVW